jgi:hypothetical protein
MQKLIVSVFLFAGLSLIAGWSSVAEAGGIRSCLDIFKFHSQQEYMTASLHTQISRQTSLVDGNDFSRLTPHLGEPVNGESLQKIEKRDQKANYFLLGEGTGGGAVYRAITATSHFNSIHKVYFSGVQRNGDIDSLSFLNLVKGRSLPRMIIIKPDQIGERSLVYQDVRGKSLDRVLRENEVSENGKLKLVNDWNDFNYRVRDFLDKHSIKYSDWYYENEVPIYSIAAEFVWAGRPVKIWLKPDNVIVEEKSGQLWLTDPF